MILCELPGIDSWGTRFDLLLMLGSLTQIHCPPFKYCIRNPIRIPITKVLRHHHQDRRKVYLFMVFSIFSHVLHKEDNYCVNTS